MTDKNEIIESLILRANNWRTLCFASELAYKKLMIKYIHEKSVTESYRWVCYKESALYEQRENNNEEAYKYYSKLSDKAYRRANKWREIYRKMTTKTEGK